MTTKLLPRLLATGVLAVGLATISTIVGVAGSAHATPVVSDARSTDGSLKVNLNSVDLHMASHSVAEADALCTSTIIPTAATIDASKIHDPVCAQVVHQAGVTYVGQSVPVQISFYGDHTITRAIRTR
jgi:hypothetical protein